MTEKPSVSADIPAHAYPFTIEARTVADDRVVWSQVVEGPGVLEVPGLRSQYGEVHIVTRYADGTTADSATLEVYTDGQVADTATVVAPVTRPDIDCPRAKTFMTPCIARDGHLALADDGRCVGCSSTPLELLEELATRLSRSRREQLLDESTPAITPTTPDALANLLAKYVAAYVDDKDAREAGVDPERAQ